MPGPAPTAPHGTTSAYKRHLRHGERPCGECREAWAEYHRGRYKAQQKREWDAAMAGWSATQDEQRQMLREWDA